MLSTPAPAPAPSHSRTIRAIAALALASFASQALVRGAKARALMHGRYHASIKDIQALAQPILRHRIMTNFYAASEGIDPDNIVERLIGAVPLPKSGM